MSGVDRLVTEEYRADTGRTNENIGEQLSRSSSPKNRLLKFFSAILIVFLFGFATLNALQLGALSSGFDLFFSSANAEAAQPPIWYEDFEGEVDSGRHNRSGCGRQVYTSDFAYRGERSHKSEITLDPCPDNPLRYYPTFDGNFKLPVLVTYWFYMDADNWADAARNRFSPLTVKETSGVPDARIFTTHVLSSGIMDCGHCAMSFQSKTVKVPLNRWTLQSAYVENKINSKTGRLETHVTLFVNDQLVVEGVVDNTFEEGFVKHWHMGLYADRKGDGSGLLTMYNDEMTVRSVVNRADAENFIRQELGGPQSCQADSNGDQVVDALDLQSLVNAILSPPSDQGCFDLNGDQNIDEGDIQIMTDVILGGN